MNKQWCSNNVVLCASNLVNDDVILNIPETLFINFYID